VGGVSFRDRLLERSLVYRAVQAPLVAQKLRPLREHGELSTVRRVLDVGCGPGTNAPMFAAQEYVGVDINPRYVEDARRRYGRDFLVADASDLGGRVEPGFDLILVNSLLHHLPDDAAVRTLAGLDRLLADDGHIHVIDLVLPSSLGVARALARADRGSYARPLEEWRAIFESAFEPVVFEPFQMGLRPLLVWELVYFKGRQRAGSRGA
jgi:SAM-dependent methyltransferase